jgi:hypothetical protein
MLVTLFPMVTLVKPVQKPNAELPMLVTLFPMTTLVKPVQYQNASIPMLVTLLGMVTLVKAVLLKKAEPPIATTGYTPSVAGIVIAPPAPVYPVIVALPPDSVYS